MRCATIFDMGKFGIFLDKILVRKVKNHTNTRWYLSFWTTKSIPSRKNNHETKSIS